MENALVISSSVFGRCCLKHSNPICIHFKILWKLNHKNILKPIHSKWPCGKQNVSVIKKKTETKFRVTSQITKKPIQELNMVDKNESIYICGLLRLISRLYRNNIDVDKHVLCLC